jgi:hypothetical protein
MTTTCDQRINHASSGTTAPEIDGLRAVSNPLLWAATTINRQPSATGREQNDDISLDNSDQDQDQEQDFIIDHPQDRHAEYQKVCDILDSVLEMIEDDDFSF